MKEDLAKKVIPGLNPLPEDERDFSHSTVFGAIPAKDLPEGDFVVATPLEIKDQGNTDFCGAYAACAVSEDQENVPLNPEYVFMQSKLLTGDPEAWGQNLRAICKVCKMPGMLEQQYYPFLNSPDFKRDDIVDPENWDIEDLAPLAFEHRKNSYFKVDGPYDTFDNFRMALWQNREEARSILTGALWRESWTLAKGGIIPKENKEEQKFGHAFKIFGQVVHEGELYLVAQLSNGTKIGDHGIFYFPREVVNREFTFGAYMFKDMGKDEARYYSENGMSVNDGFFKKLFKVIRHIIRTHLGI